MNRKQKEVFAEKLIDIANFAAGALLIGQIIANNWIWTMSGLAIFVVFYGVAYRLLNDLNQEEG